MKVHSFGAVASGHAHGAPVIGIVGYGIGNVKSIVNMLGRIGHHATVCLDADSIRAADRLILPGVGSFDSGMRQLNNSGMRPALEESVDAGTPVLGICLGMQLLGSRSEEGLEAGLGWLPARAVRLPAHDDLPLPHMGWNWIAPQGPSLLFNHDETPLRFYFLHSYALVCDEPEMATATATYGEVFVCSVAHNNVFGVQFHPEKSHRFGMRVLDRFARGTP